MIFSLKNFNKMRNNIYNLGLSSANLTVATGKRNKEKCEDLQIKIVDNKKIQIKEITVSKKIEKKDLSLNTT